jgi:hypothetical protein
MRAVHDLDLTSLCFDVRKLTRFHAVRRLKRANG